MTMRRCVAVPVANRDVVSCITADWASVNRAKSKITAQRTSGSGWSRASSHSAICFASTIFILVIVRAVRAGPWQLAERQLDFQKLRTVGEILIALVGDQHDIFQSYTANSEVIKSGFYGHHMSALEGGIDRC